VWTALAGRILSHKNLRLTGLATHLAVSDSSAPADAAYTGDQMLRFGKALRAASMPPTAGGSSITRIPGLTWSAPASSSTAMTRSPVNLGRVGQTPAPGSAGNSDARNGDATLMAERLGTIPYKITCGISRRVPRVYV
jgi:alanine racemase